MLKKILPVGIGLLVILAIVVVLSAVKSANDRMPTFEGEDQVYVDYDGYKITYGDLYNQMKNTYSSHMSSCYGLLELVNLVDNKIFAEEVNKVDVSSDDFVNYVLDGTLGIDKDWTSSDDEELEDMVEGWENILTSLKLNSLIDSVEANKIEKDQFSVASLKATQAWTVLCNEYKLSFARDNWAKTKVIENYLEEMGTTEAEPLLKRITDEDDDNYKNTVDYYYTSNYSSKVNAIVIPFTSKASCLEAMKQAHINTTSTLLSSGKWVKDSYNYNTTVNPAETDYLTYQEVLTAFVEMFNKVYNYQSISLSASDFEQYESEALTVSAIEDNASKALAALTIGKELIINNDYHMTIGEKVATINFVVNSDYTSKVEVEKGESTTSIKAVEDNFSDTNTSYTVKIDIEITYGDISVSTTTVSIKFNNNDSEAAVLSTIDQAEAVMLSDFTADALTKATDSVHFVFDEEVCSANSSLDTYLCPADVIAKSTTTYIPTDVDNLNKVYTASPVSVGDYYCLIMLLSTDEMDEHIVDEDGNILNQDLFDEISGKMIEDLYTDNALSEVIYELRDELGLKIYDRFLEAVYAYNHDYFFGTTLSQTDYDKFETVKHNQKQLVASFKSDSSKKKNDCEINAKELFDSMEAKYASSVISTMTRQYEVISSEFNKIYNSYTDTVVNKEVYRSLLTGEVNSFQKNFEAGYFTYSSLSSYFVPNFPAKYGWSNFIRDYFNAYKDQDLLTSSLFGGSIYSSTLNALSIDVLTDATLLQEKLTEAQENYFDVTVVNLLVQIDTDMDSDAGSEEADNWTDDQVALAKELCNVMFENAYKTNKSTFYAQLSELVSLYNAGSIEGTSDDINNPSFFAKYKAAGLLVKVEVANQYTSSSSIVSEFADVCRDLYKNHTELHGTTIDDPTTCTSAEAFKSVYGYHMIACTAMGKASDTPSTELMRNYYIEVLRAEAEEQLESAKEYAETYANTTYQDIYEAQVTYYTFVENMFAEMIKDVEFTESDKQAIQDWYLLEDDTNGDSGIKADLDSSAKLTLALFEKVEAKVNNNKVTFVNEAAKTKFAEFLTICKEEYQED